MNDSHSQARIVEILSHFDSGDLGGWDSVWLEVDGPDALDWLITELQLVQRERDILRECLGKCRKQRLGLEMIVDEVSAALKGGQ